MRYVKFVINGIIVRLVSYFNDQVTLSPSLKKMEEVLPKVKKLYVGNLPYEFGDSDLEGIFAEYGDIESSVIITDKRTGRSKGFGFVELADDELADKAIEDLNGSDVGGRNIVVNTARPKEY